MKFFYFIAMRHIIIAKPNVLHVAKTINSVKTYLKENKETPTILTSKLTGDYQELNV